MKAINNLELAEISKNLSFIGQKLYMMSTGDSRIPSDKEYKETLIKKLEEAIENLKEEFGTTN